VWPTAAQINDKKLWVVWVGSNYDNYDIYYKTSSEIIYHDVAVIDISPSSAEIYHGEKISINVTVENQGDYTENMTVNCYVNSTLIGSQEITLPSANSSTIVFWWNTSDFALGKYVLNATVNVVPGETTINTYDNILVNGVVKVKIHGDINGDGSVDSLDLIRFSEAYGSTSESLNWDKEADINRDEVVTIVDLILLSENYGKTT
jgi:hypothetical protein